jgi:transposase
MLTLSNAHPVYLAVGATDLRKSVNGLAALVQEGYGLNPFSPSLFVFCNRERNKLKLLFWEVNGFWLLSCIRDKSHYPEIFVILKFQR